MDGHISTSMDCHSCISMDDDICISMEYVIRLMIIYVKCVYLWMMIIYVYLSMVKYMYPWMIICVYTCIFFTTHSCTCLDNCIHSIYKICIFTNIIHLQAWSEEYRIFPKSLFIGVVLIGNLFIGLQCNKCTRRWLCLLPKQSTYGLGMILDLRLLYDFKVPSFVFYWTCQQSVCL